MQIASLDLAPIDAQRGAPAAAPRPPAPEGLYVHVPFCVRKCGYCDFFSLQLPAGRKAPDAERYLAALARELASLSEGFRPRTVFVGGGTPTELSLVDLERLLTLLERAVDLGGVEEWTVEANPGTLDRDKAALLRARGVTRVSLGVQSFDDRNLRFLDRIHSGDDARRGYELLRAAGFDNVNLDLIGAIPGSSADTLARDLDIAIALGPEHLACYSLIFEEGTPLEALRRRGGVRPIDDDEEATQYEMARALLTQAGYEPYEISNYARRRDGRLLTSQHNLLYWGPGTYHGVGPAAASHVDRARYGNVRSLERWSAAWLGGDGKAPDPAAARAYEERLEPVAWARETLVMWLRRSEGIDAEAFLAATGFALEALAGPRLEALAAQGLLERLPRGGARLTERALFLSDGIFAELV